MSRSSQIIIQDRNDGLPWGDLVQILEGIFPFKFSWRRPVGDIPEDEIRLEYRPGDSEGEIADGKSVLKVARWPVGIADADLGNEQLDLADNPEVPFPFRGRSLDVRVPRGWAPLAVSNSETILAACRGRPVWVASSSQDEQHFRSAFPLPTLSFEQGLHDVLNGNRFWELVPLLHWLRQIDRAAALTLPALRACFVFDDPNLHWRKYGFVDFQEIANRASKHNYHVAFATIPLDAWFSHRGTAGIFKANVDRLSLCIHGNNHTKAELARPTSEGNRFSMLIQARRRIEELERKTGLGVSRVMIPPHGACVRKTPAALPHCGYEGACISHGSLRAHNKQEDWTRLLGYLPSELIDECPVLPRWAFAGDCTNTILLAAYLGQPLILRGHHQDLKDGVELLDKLAGIINTLGPIAWTNLQD